MSGEKRAGHPVADFLKATLVVGLFFTVLSIPVLTLVTAGVLIALLIAGVWL